MKHWTREDLQKAEELQKLTQAMIESLIGRELSAAPIDQLVLANEHLARAQIEALAEIEHREMALGFAEALRQFAVPEGR